ncbi:hypothetical protein COCOBI_14-0580 [Coccomyxa sp. Obi]|nr:hypothetical protein COCOBI_14-0580 [Coccomyxa sp. Obi]
MSALAKCATYGAAGNQLPQGGAAACGARHKSKEQELRNATKAKEPLEVITLIREERDRLVKEKNDMRQQLTTLQTCPASQPGTSSLSEEQLLERIQPQLKRQLDSELERRFDSEFDRRFKRERSGFTYSFAGDLAEESLWKRAVDDADVPCEIVPLDELLVPSRSMLAKLRYLRFLLMEAPAVSLSSILQMRSKRQQENQKHDLELPYHPVIVAVAKAAAAGQPEISFLKEDHHGPARPDMRCCINGQPKYPAECKPKFGLAHKGSPDGIASNRAGLSKLLKVVLSLHGDQASGEHTCLYFSRSEYVWVAQFVFGHPGKLTSVHVSPAFPHDPLQFPPQGRLMDLAQLGMLSNSACLSDLLPPAMPAGFELLVQYADNLCQQEGIEKVQLEAKWLNNQPVDFTDASVIASSPKSLVVRLTPASDSVVKTSLKQLVARERELHLILDGRSQHLRRMTDPSQYAEVSSGVLPGLAMLELAGYGEPLQTHHMQRNSLGRVQVWD